jgi:hypothetical protein
LLFWNAFFLTRRECVALLAAPVVAPMCCAGYGMITSVFAQAFYDI